MRNARFLIPILFLVGTLNLSAQAPAVRVLFFTGPVTLNGKSKPSIGQQVVARDEFVLGAAATLQLSVNGKVIKYAQPAKVRVADAVKRAGKGENTAVANTVRTLAAASSGKSGHTSQAGATRVEGNEAEQVTQARRDAEAEARARADAEIRDRTGIENPVELGSRLADLGNKNERLVILEPRTTAVSPGPIQFRWLRTSSVDRYVVSVRDHMGQEIFRTETGDTSAVWDGTELQPEAIYNWTLLSAQNEEVNASASFNRLSETEGTNVRAGIEAIRKELGAGNPALPVVLGAYCADHGCYGEATRHYTAGAVATPEHFGELMGRATEIYRESIGLNGEELGAVYRTGE